jgi:hypothetical protein
LLRMGAVRPGCFGEVGYLLEGQPRGASRVAEDQPVLARRVGVTGVWGFVAGAVVESEQLTVELGKGSGVGAVQDDLA